MRTSVFVFLASLALCLSALAVYFQEAEVSYLKGRLSEARAQRDAAIVNAEAMDRNCRKAHADDKHALDEARAACTAKDTAIKQVLADDLDPDSPAKLCRNRNVLCNAVRGNLGQPLLDELIRLRAVVERLPKTVDGQPMVPGMKVYWKSKAAYTIEGIVICEIDRMTAYHEVIGTSDLMPIPEEWAYSIRADAEAAGKAGGP